MLCGLMEFIAVEYDTENELPVPFDWRETIERIATAINSKSPLSSLQAIENVSFEDAIIKISLDQIADYPASQIYVGPKTWERSIYIWEEGYWSLLVDLHIDDDLDEVSDLVLPVKVVLEEGVFHFQPNFVHVP